MMEFFSSTMESPHTYWLDVSSKLEGYDSMMLFIKAIYYKNFRRGLLFPNVDLGGSTCSQESHKVFSNHMGLLTKFKGFDLSLWLLALEVSNIVSSFDPTSYVPYATACRS
jgi:hypothetical protein